MASLTHPSPGGALTPVRSGSTTRRLGAAPARYRRPGVGPFEASFSPPRPFPNRGQAPEPRPWSSAEASAPGKWRVEVGAPSRTGSNPPSPVRKRAPWPRYPTDGRRRPPPTPDGRTSRRGNRSRPGGREPAPRFGKTANHRPAPYPRRRGSRRGGRSQSGGRGLALDSGRGGAGRRTRYRPSRDRRNRQPPARP
ncbi:hypothetical protein GCM10009574_025540 [Streptomyces asiaticus]|uniref:Uncharacterized protein n=2 Tax=Streptomyces rhizosphaericus TaxID=114699 RepID=A0ABN1S0C6_9ACTN